MMASYSVTKLNIPFIPTGGGFFTVNLPMLDPNEEINVADRTWEWLGRASGGYLFPGGVQVSANFEHRSGTPWARLVSARGGQQIPSQTLRVEPIGTRRLPHLNLLNVRAEKAFPLAHGHKVALRLNLYNASNVNTVLTVNQLSGPTFLTPTSIAPPRIAEASATYTF